MNEKIIKRKLNLIYLIFFAAAACYSPFLIVYFSYKNLDFTQIGLIFAAMSVVGVISQPIWGYITDRYLNARITLIIVMLCSCICVFLLTFASGFGMIFITVVMISIFQNSVFPILDSLCYQLSSQYSCIQYGRVRLRGSFGYAVSVLLSGIVIKYTSIYIPYYIYCFLIMLGVILTHTLKYEAKPSGKVVSFRDISSLFKESRFVVFILSVMLLNISMGANSNYIGELIKQTGGDVSNLGLLWFIVAMSEIPVLYFSSRILSAIKDLKLYYACIIFFGIRFFADSLAASWQVVIAIQVLQFITFALYIISALHYINRIVEPEMRTSSITIYTAAGGGLGGFIGNLGGGLILGILDVFWLFKILAIVCIASLIVGLFLKSE